MNDQELSTTKSPSLAETGSASVSDEQKNPAFWGHYEEAELLERLRQAGEIDPESLATLEAGLASEQDPVRLWFLLASIEQIPARTVATDLVFKALCRLTSSRSPLMRMAAYRWLSGLYRIDLRFETRAKLTLRDCLAAESGPMLKRLEYFLSIC